MPEETASDPILILDDIQQDIGTKQIFDLIMSDLSEDEQVILNDEKVGYLQTETAEKLGISDSSLSKKKDILFKRLNKKYKRIYNPE